MKVVTTLVLLFAVFGTIDLAVGTKRILFDFIRVRSSLDSWYEHSDVQYRRGAGDSKAIMNILRSDTSSEAVFFGLANAGSYANGRAIYRTDGNWDMSKVSKIIIKCRARVASAGQYAIVLRHKGLNYGPSNTVYLAEFTPTTDFSTHEIPLTSFTALESEGSQPLDTSNITNIGIVLGVGAGEFATGTLEINWIAAE